MGDTRLCISIWSNLTEYAVPSRKKLVIPKEYIKNVLELQRIDTVDQC